MRTVSYDVLLRGVCDAMGWDAENLDAREWHAAKRAISNALSTVWQYNWWPDLMRVELRRYRDAWIDTLFYLSASEVWHEASRAYYVALRNVPSGQAPATLTAGKWMTNVAYWGLLQRSNSAAEYSASKVYAAGDQAFLPATGKTYQAHTTTLAGTPPTNIAYWGELTPFDAYVPTVQEGFRPIGHVRQVSARNPRVYRGPSRLEWYLSDRGVEVSDAPTPVEVWVEHRLGHPQLVGDIYDASTPYEAALPKDLTELPELVRVACLGDSITYGTGVLDRDNAAFPKVLGNLMGRSFDVRNFGASGATLARAGDLPIWTRGEFTAATRFVPHIVVVMLGTNDTKSQNWFGGPTFQADLNALLDHFEAQPARPAAQVWVCTPPPIYINNFGLSASRLQNDVIPAINAVCAARALPVININLTLTGFPQYFTDGVHPNATAHGLIAQALKTAIRP